MPLNEMGEHWRRNDKCVWGNDKAGFQQVELDTRLEIFLTQLVIWV